MLNLNELESKWLQYKIKSLMPYAIGIVSILIGIYVLTSILNTTGDTQIKSTPQLSKMEIITKEELLLKEINTSEPVKNILPQALIVQKHIPVYVSPNKKINITPSMNFMMEMKGDSPEYYQSERLSYTPKKTAVQKKPKVEFEEETYKEEKTIEKDTIVRIKRRNTDDDIEYVIKRFKQSNNPTLSLFIAKKYYELQNYSQAYNYALITNELNNSLEDSWLIFAKSLVKLKEKEKAIKTLKKYIFKSHSKKAKVLLANIKSGKIK